MNEPTNARDNQRHHNAQRVNQQRRLDVERAHGDPLPECHGNGALFGWEPQQRHEKHDRDSKRAK